MLAVDRFAVSSKTKSFKSRGGSYHAFSRERG
jgi:hypothetical protein